MDVRARARVGVGVERERRERVRQKDREEIDVKEMAHTIMGACKSEISRVGWRDGYSGKV